jgi:hypothetical protein
MSALRERTSFRVADGSFKEDRAALSENDAQRGSRWRRRQPARQTGTAWSEPVLRITVAPHKQNRLA